MYHKQTTEMTTESEVKKYVGIVYHVSLGIGIFVFVSMFITVCTLIYTLRHHEGKTKLWLILSLICAILVGILGLGLCIGAPVARNMANEQLD